jgi:hypothetical protein
MNEHYHDHEQDERDYYERSFTRRHEYAWWAFRWMIKLIIPMLLLSWLFFGCSSAQPIATESTGTVIQVDGERVLVTFKVVNKKYADQGVNWFYIPGHSYQEGDRYPDPKKDPSLGSSLRGRRNDYRGNLLTGETASGYASRSDGMTIN